MTVDTEPQLQKILLERQQHDGLAPYTPQNEKHIQTLLECFFSKYETNATISHVKRLGGGASKEQFVFTLNRSSNNSESPNSTSYVLRMDPQLAITETDRLREYEILKAFQGIVPTPKPVWIDSDMEVFPKPAMIMELVSGVTQPSVAESKVSGLGTLLGDPLRGKLKNQFLDILTKIHAFDWRNAELPSFSIPKDDPKQAVRWCFNYWHELLEQSSIAREPVVAVATQWLRQHMPDAEQLVIVHGDYRTGNYLFNENSGTITAMLDWELAYIGDFHDDVAWVLLPIFGTVIDGVFRANDLFSRDEFIAAYENATGRTINQQTLHYYEVFNTWKCYIIVAALGVKTARSQQNHQDVLLTYLSAAGPLFVDELCRLLSEEV